MRLSKPGYYADFVLYPVAFAALAGAALWTATLEQASVWLAAFLAAATLWTLIEYGLHRFILHRVPYINDMHDAHHNDQKALIGSPTWLSGLMIAGLAFVPSFLLFDFTIASGITNGLMLGYLWYVIVHHLIHHGRRIGPETVVYRLKRRHMLHHHFDETGNFGVISGLWDKVFRTEINVRLVGSAVR
jgi:sterol desaturase/sphingolipid hydroxylase (fatty acid hydroxylase superfamily)